jgi:diaminohydroxyphosphoribosylaminopyrimidine deaminase / 5-amino-6-(5-phosphoribosylamino)uracil reductase
VVDTRLRTPASSQVCDTQHAPTILFHGPGVDAAHAAVLTARGVELVELPLACGSVDLGAMLDVLGARDIVRLMVEGGPKLIDALMRRGLVDRVSAFVAPVLLGDPAAPGISAGMPATRMSDALRLRDVRVRRFGDDALLEGHVSPLDHERAHGYACEQS